MIPLTYRKQNAAYNKTCKEENVLYKEKKKAIHRNRPQDLTEVRESRKEFKN